MSFLNKVRSLFGPRMFSITTSTVEVMGQDNLFKPEYLLGMDIQQLQQKALEILWKSAHAQSALNQISVLAMNCGLRLQSTPNKDILGISSDEANSTANTLESLFELIRKSKLCSYEENKNFNEQEILAFWSWLVWNEAFAIFRYRPNSNSVVPVSVQIINPMLVQSPSATSRSSYPDSTFENGIEFIKGKPVAFWVRSKTVSGGITNERILLKGTRSQKTIGVHVFRGRVPGQFRGVSRLAPVFHELQRIIEAFKYEMDSMAVNARLAMAVERTKPVNNPDKFAAIMQSGGDLMASINNELQVKNVGNDQGGLIIQSGEPGETFKPFDTSRPNVNINEFVFGVMKAIGPAIGIPFELWLALFGKAYSASKGSIDLGFKSFDQEIFEFSSGFEQPYYEATVAAMVAWGMVSLPRWNEPVMRASYLSARWYGIPKPSLNPLQEEKAATERVKNWRSSVEREAQLSTGVSFDIVADRREHEIGRIYDIESLYVQAEVTPESLEA